MLSPKGDNNFFTSLYLITARHVYYHQFRMKKYLSISLLLYLLFVGTHAYAQANEQQKEVQQTMIKIFDGMSALDLTEVQKYTTKDFILLEDGVVWNMDTLALKIEPLKKTKFSRVNHLDFINTEIIGNAAWLAYHNAADYTVNGQKNE